MALVQIASNPVVAKLIGADRDTKTLVSELLSYIVEGAERTDSFAAGHWDGRSSFFNYRRATFPAGFLALIHKSLKSRGFDVKLIRNKLPKPLGPENPVVDSFGYNPDYSYQTDTVDRLLKYGIMIANCATGCHAKDTDILMFDGAMRKVQDIKVGDELMGPDSKPRQVLNLHRGHDEMFKIKPTRGDDFIVNGGHILSLEQTRVGDGRKEAIFNGRWVNISVQDFIQQNKTFRHIHKLHRSRGICFDDDSNLPLDSYSLGALLGDGYLRANSPTLTSNDQEMVDWAENLADSLGMKTTIYKRGNTAQISFVNYRRGEIDGAGLAGRGVKNKLGKILEDLGLAGLKSGAKFIPHIYKIASPQRRADILAGLMDTDGHLHNGGFDYVSKSKNLAQDVAFIARSIGLRAVTYSKTITSGRYAGNTYHRVSISGDCSIIPCKLARKAGPLRMQIKDVCLTGFSIEPVGKGDYYGFEVDEDNLYLLGDFTVTHNSGKSRIAKLAVARIRRPTLFLTTRSVLMYQMKTGFEEAGFRTGVLGDSQWSLRKGVNVGMVQTIMARLKDPDEDATPEAHARQLAIQAQTKKLLSYFEFIIGEEAHEAGGNGYYEILSHCKNAHYRLALTATPFMRDDAEANMRLMGCFGPVGIRITEKKLIDLGILARPCFKYITPAVPKSLYRSTGWQRAYKLGIIENESRNADIVYEAKRGKLYGLTSMVLIQRKKHGEILAKMMELAGLKVRFIYGKHEQTERTLALKQLEAGEIDVLIGTTILEVGVDVPAVGIMILAGGGKAEVALRQQIGRGLRAKKKGPNVVLIVCFMDGKNTHLIGHSKTRKAIVDGTPGFAEQVLATGADFNYKSLGFSKAA